MGSPNYCDHLGACVSLVATISKILIKSLVLWENKEVQLSKYKNLQKALVQQ